ncbi:MAG: sulfotransferase domain-containing protein [Melioribacteraceae bacterium]|nr:sulfotransferase domain-containing protein [Melioribacteraceae bacterium]MCO6472635.1 sulfotransferase domain-containing protein [Melioribacteraceae bacterium]MDD3557877.1 sulfotransferase [Melioribacteraceae bacterium]
MSTHSPTFLIVGAQKAGTTSMDFYLREHPDIFLYPKKEIHFFDNDERYALGRNWYEKQFIKRKNEKAIGECSPLYMYLKNVPKRIFDMFPEIKLIFMLRNPVNRALSHYKMEVRAGRETKNFADALNFEEERILKGLYEKKYFSYKTRGLYLEQIERYLKFFDREQMHFVILEEMKNNPEKVMKRIFNFLDVDPGIKLTRIYKSPRYVGKMPLSLKENYIFKNSPLGKIKFFRRAHDFLLTKYSTDVMNSETEFLLYDYFKVPNENLFNFLGIENKFWNKR